MDTLLAIRMFGVMLLCAGSAWAQTPFRAELDGTQTVPPTPTTATGECTGTLDAAGTQFTFSCTHSVINATFGHIHLGERGVDGDIVFGFAHDGCCPESSTWFLTAEDAANLMAGRLHVNIHSMDLPTEAIRGQFLPQGGAAGPDNNGGDVGGGGGGGAGCGSFEAGAAAMALGSLTLLRLSQRRTWMGRHRG